MSTAYGRLAAIRDYWMPRDQNARVEVRVADLDAVLTEHVRLSTLQAEAYANHRDAERYRWLRAEHERVDPLCHLVWKRNGDRNGSEWVNPAEIDAAIDAAMGVKR